MTEPGGPATTARRRARMLAWPAPALAAVIVAAGCTFPELASPTPRPTPTASPTPSPTPTPEPATPTPDPTPDPAAIPDLAAGEIAASLIDGLRVRQRPGTEAPISTGLLPLGAEMGVVMGPFPLDGFGWYLVTDEDPAEPKFEEGWVAAGYEPDPFLEATGDAVPDSPYVASMDGTGNAEHGPIEITDEDHAIRWIASDPERRGCAFAVSLARSGGDPVPVIRATVGGGVDRGTLQPQTFASLGVRGTVFANVESDCAWALVLERVDRDAEPTPSDEG